MTADFPYLILVLINLVVLSLEELKLSVEWCGKAGPNKAKHYNEYPHSQVSFVDLQDSGSVLVESVIFNVCFPCV